MYQLKVLYYPYQTCNVGTILGHYLRRWPDIETLPDQCILIIIGRGVQRVSVWSRL